MLMYNAVVETATKNYDTDAVLEQLQTFHASLSQSPRGWATARVSLPAESLSQACTIATTVVAAAYGADAIACEVMTETEFDAREGFVPVPELIGATDAAELLGVSRQRVQQLAEAGTLPATKVGRSLVFPRPAVEALRNRAVHRS